MDKANILIHPNVPQSLHNAYIIHSDLMFSRDIKCTVVVVFLMCEQNYVILSRFVLVWVCWWDAVLYHMYHVRVFISSATEGVIIVSKVI